MSAISGFINTIRNAVYGEQVRGAIISALEQCYSDVNSPSLQTAAFTAALNAAYAGGILDIQTVTQISAMTNQNIIYRYNGTEAGRQKGLYYYSPLSSSWVLIGSEIHSVSNSNQMTDTNSIYKYTGTQSGMVQNSLYCYNGTAWVPIGSGLLEASTAAMMTNTNAIYKYTGNENGYIYGCLYYHDGTRWTTLDEPKSYSSKLWVRGNLSGADLSNVYTRMSMRKTVYASEDVTVIIPEYMEMGVHYFDADGTFISNTPWIKTPKAFVIPKGSYYRLTAHVIPSDVTFTAENIPDYVSKIFIGFGAFGLLEKQKLNLTQVLEHSAYVNRNIKAAVDSIVSDWFNSQSALPTGYTEHDYIEKTNTHYNSYIDLGFPVAQTDIRGMTFSIEFALAQDASSEGNPFGLGRKVTGVRPIAVFVNPSHGTALAVHYCGSDSGWVIPVDAVTQKNKLTFYNGQVYLNDGDDPVFTASGVSSETLDPIVLFAGWNGGSLGAGFKGKIYSFSLSINDVKMIDLVPATDADGNVGFYDLARSKFILTSIPSNFIAGDDE